MPINKSNGNMYNFVDYMHTHIGGECAHQCSYCLVNNPRFGRPQKYTGEQRPIEEEFGVKYKKYGIYFIEHMNDIGTYPKEWINRIIDHCAQWPDNVYVFQSKNPLIFWGTKSLTKDWNCDFSKIRKLILGTTIETNRKVKSISLAPDTTERLTAMRGLNLLHYMATRLKIKTFVTIEPILDFDVQILAQWMIDIRPNFVNIGADSKRNRLPEPSWEKVESLIKTLKNEGIEVREKNNLNRLKK